MDFFEALAVSKWILKRQGRVSYRMLARELEVDAETITQLRHELIAGQRLAADDGDVALMWIGDSKTMEEPSGDALVPYDSLARAEKRPIVSGLDRKPPASCAPIAERPTAAPDTGAERRQLTVMFCDLVGSTELSTRLDPEDLRELIAQFQDCCREAIERYDGFIARYMGDGMLVYFGYPAAHEDDPARAARAGLDMVSKLAELDARLDRRAGVELALRVGIATGPVVVGDIIGTGASEEAAVIGETPNLAARLQGLAAPGQIVVSQKTRKLLGDAFDCDDLGARQLKGIESSVEVWRVIGPASAPSSPGSHELYTRAPLLGREEELGLLQRAWVSSQGGHGQVVLVRGEPGIGKSRLLASLRTRAEGASARTFVVRCSPYHANTALYPVIECLERSIGFLPTDGATQKLEKLEHSLSFAGSTRQRALVLLAELLSVPLPEGRGLAVELEPRQRREQTLDLLVNLLAEESQSRPTLLLWEDLHWADPTTLELLELIVGLSPMVRALNVLTFRPEFEPPWPMRSNVTSITLNRMERTEVSALIEHLGRGKNVPACVVEHVTSKADGVPLYVEELTKAILESELLTEHDDRFELSGSLNQMHVPATLNDALMARLDRISTVRELIQIAAVLGREFSYEHLNSLSTMNEASLREGLARIVSEELLYARGRPPHARYVFKHALVQEAAYGSILKRTRKRYHADAAAWLEEHDEEAGQSRSELIARHHACAGNDEAAATHWQRAGEHAFARCANSEALHHLQSALEHLERLPESYDRDSGELDARVAFGLVLLVLRGIGDAEVRQNYMKARTLCTRVGNATQRFSVLHGLSLSLLTTEDAENQAMAVSQELLELAVEIDDEGLLLEAHRAVGTAALNEARLDLALEHFEAGIALYDPARDRSLANTYGACPGLLCHAFSAWISFLQGQGRQCRLRIEEALSIAPGLEHPYSESAVLSFAAMLEQLRGDPAATKERARTALAFAEQHGFSLFISWAGVLEAWADIALGTAPGTDALVRLREGMQAWQASGGQSMMHYRICLYAEACLVENAIHEGLAALDTIASAPDTARRNYFEPDIERLRGELLLRIQEDNPDQEADAPRECFERALATARELGLTALAERAAKSLSRIHVVNS